MGRAAAFLEPIGRRLGPRGQLTFGAVVASLLPAAVALMARAILKWATRTPWLRVLCEAALLKSAFSVRALLTEGLALRRLLEAGDLEGARRRAQTLVSRDTSSLGVAHLVSAGLESLAENTADAFLAPWLYYVMAGTPGALAYRAVNTLDAMWGYHGQYEYLGKAAARLDDLANLAPARLAAGLLALASGRPLAALATAMAQHRRTESPNAGWTMAALAGALDVELEKVGHYRLGRPGRPLTPALLEEGVSTTLRTAALGAILVIGLLLAKGEGNCQWRPLPPPEAESRKA